MTSNPFFAFHDDVFPGFIENNVAQPPFSRPGRSTFGYLETIIPERFFSSLEELKHISTIEMKLNGTDNFQFEVDFHENASNRKIFECNFFDGMTLFDFGISANGSILIDSDFFDGFVIIKSNSTAITKLELSFSSSNSSALSFIETFGSKLPMNGPRNIENGKLRILKLDRATKIRNFFHTTGKKFQINAIRRTYSGETPPFSLHSDAEVQILLFFMGRAELE